MSEITKSPTSVYIPALDYPAPLAKVIAVYEAAHEAWTAAYMATVAADADLTKAPGQDTEALVTAAAAGKPHPGEKHAETARKALEMAEENCRTAREKATAQTDVMKAALSDSTDLLIPLVLDHIRATANHYEAVLADCKAKEGQAHSDLTSAIGAMQMVVPHLAKNYGLSQVWTGVAVTAPTWPANTSVLLEAKLTNLERHLANAKTARETRSRERVTS